MIKIPFLGSRFRTNEVAKRMPRDMLVLPLRGIADALRSRMDAVSSDSSDVVAIEPRPVDPLPHPHEHVRPPVNPDPKAHPMHPAVTPQPPDQGTDPKQPVRERGRPDR